VRDKSLVSFWRKDTESLDLVLSLTRKFPFLDVVEKQRGFLGSSGLLQVRCPVLPRAFARHMVRCTVQVVCCCCVRVIAASSVTPHEEVGRLLRVAPAAAETAADSASAEGLRALTGSRTRRHPHAPSDRGRDQRVDANKENVLAMDRGAQTNAPADVARKGKPRLARFYGALSCGAASVSAASWRWRRYIRGAVSPPCACSSKPLPCKLVSDVAPKQNDRAQSSRGGLDEVVQSMSKKDKPRLCTGLQATAREAALHVWQLS
jgi:hypothetical protein